jgi:uncharacterized heparinase superfamily protein
MLNALQFSRVYQTIRHLRPIQVINRLQRRVVRPSWRRLPAPALRKSGGRWQPPCQKATSLVGPLELQVFQQRVRLQSAEDWHNAQLPHLVLYNLHYFDDLMAVQCDRRTQWQQALVEQWIAQNPPGRGPGWEPYPLSLRIVNWIKWHLNGYPLSPSQLDSLATQVQALDEQIEFHLLANHLLANAKALVFAGIFFEGSLADRWLCRGSRLVQQQLAEQVLADGGHFELSPMYHSIILEDVLDLLNLMGAYPSVARTGWAASLPQKGVSMLRWLRAMTHPDGQIALFNDAALDIAAAPDQLHQYGVRLGLTSIPQPVDGIVHLASSGYVRMQLNESVVLADLAKIGPDYQPGHAHADTLSFEWSLGGQRVIVNSGTSCYGQSAERQRQRSTAAHNTVEVDGENSSEVWSGFRVARRAYPGDVELAQTADQLQVGGSHDGYQRLPGCVTHSRQWTLGGDRLHVLDTLSGHPRSAIARFHLHPDMAYRPGSAAGEFQLQGAQHLLQASIVGGTPRCVSSTYHPRFDVSTPNSCVESTLKQSAHELLLSWSAH